MTGTTPQQFAALVDRAIREGLTCRRDRRNPHLMLVSSSKDTHRFYRVTRTHCTCKSFHLHHVCKHLVYAAHMADTGQAPFRGVARPLEVKEVVIGEVIRARVAA